MSGWTGGLLIAYAAVVLVWVARLVVVRLLRRRLVFLTLDSLRLEHDADLPLVSVLVPARNEAGTIGDCLRSLLALDYPGLEIIVIDDRSTDHTANLVQAVAAQDSRVRLIQVKELPQGWTGKTHALHQGVSQATGDWLLFVDADTRQHPLNLRVVLGYAVREQADLVSLLPRLGSESFWERAVQPFAGIVLLILFRLPRVNSDAHPRDAFANGQYILIRRSVYEAVGGHEAVRTHFVEDIQLGRRVKSAGHRLRVALAPELSATRMYTTLREILRGWARIFYAAVDHRPWRLLGLMTAIAVFSISAFVVTGVVVALALIGTDPVVWGTLAGLNLLHHGLSWVVLAQLYGFSGSSRAGLLYFLPACLVMEIVIARAVWLCFSHRVIWRDTSYGPSLRQWR